MSRLFSASSDKAIVDSPAFSTLNNITEVTYGAWIKPTSCGDNAAAGYRALMVKNPSGVYNGMWLVNGYNGGLGAITNGISAEVFYYIGSGPATQGAYAGSVNNTINLGVWQHVALTCSTAREKLIRLYVNGVEVSYLWQLAGGNGNYVSDAAEGLYIGADNINQGGPANFDGNIAEVAVWNRVLSATELVSIATSRIGMNPGTVGWDSLVYYSHLGGYLNPEPCVTNNIMQAIVTGTTLGEDSPGYDYSYAATPHISSPVDVTINDYCMIKNPA